MWRELVGTMQTLTVEVWNGPAFAGPGYDDSLYFFYINRPGTQQKHDAGKVHFQQKGQISTAGSASGLFWGPKDLR